MRLGSVLRALRLAPLLVLTAGAPFGCKEGTGPQACCQICRGMKACGDGCIPKTETCDKPAGCACQTT